MDEGVKTANVVMAGSGDVVSFQVPEAAQIKFLQNMQVGADSTWEIEEPDYGKHPVAKFNARDVAGIFFGKAEERE